MFGWLKKTPVPGNGPDFSAINSRAKAQELVQRGELETLLLLPAEFGGEDRVENVVYVPIGIAEVKRGIDNNVIRPLVADGKITEYAATPAWQGKSFVPIAIQIVASNPGKFSTTIKIWGDALRE